MKGRLVVGLDLSLTATGIAKVHSNGAIEVERVVSKPPKPPEGHKHPTLWQRQARLSRLASDIVAVVQRAGLPTIVVIEGPAYGSKMGSMHDRSGLWWLVVEELLNLAVPVAEVSPTARIRYAMGIGRGSKEAVMAAAIRRYGQLVEIHDDNEADAILLAAMGAQRFGIPVTVPPSAHSGAIESVVWPALSEPVTMRLETAVVGSEAEL